MKQKIFFSGVLTICILASAACTSAPTTNNTQNFTAPTQASSTNLNLDATPKVNPSESAMDPILACSSGGQAAVTPELTEGPYFTANSPERADLFEEGMVGTKIVITGYVYTTDCQPVANALLDFWQADGNGVYDNNGYTLRGHQYTDAN
jgi:protocatechuate 3,4-dioxygenase beta subunit